MPGDKYKDILTYGKIQKRRSDELKEARLKKVWKIQSRGGERKIVKKAKAEKEKIIKAISLSGNYIPLPFHQPSNVLPSAPHTPSGGDVLRISFTIIFIKNNTSRKVDERENDGNFSILI